MTKRNLHSASVRVAALLLLTATPAFAQERLGAFVYRASRDALKHQQVIRELRRLATGISVYGVSKSNLSRVKIALPPLAEQEAIARVLGLMDSAINQNNQLIAQKELRKKWLMQNLLTGKKRLKGFSGEWKEIKFGEVFEYVRSYAISREGLIRSNDGSLKCCVHYGDIHALYQNAFLDFSRQQGIPRITNLNVQIDTRDFLKNGDLILADASEDYEGVGQTVEVVNIGDEVAVGGLHTIVLRDNDEIVANIFRGYLFSGESVRNALRKMATGTSVYSVTKSTLNGVSVWVPLSLEEQTAIAQVLQAADKEIQLLKTKTEKLREQKKGMMQQLLTGQKRLRVED